MRFPCVISTERSERRNLWYYSTRDVYSLFSNTICIRPSRKRSKDPFDSPPFLLGGSLRVTQGGGCAVSPLRLTKSVFCVISKAREDLPCLQRVKRARCNRRHMGACPWQLVVESASFSAADYRAQASGKIFVRSLRRRYTACRQNERFKDKFHW